jgi:leader peptidase (prepilin peptidase) / N-methyltransferase
MWADDVLVFIFGLIWGSFANVVIHRLPKGESVVWPGSRCPQCAKPIAWYDNIPVLSWLLLRGKCRKCHTPIRKRYPAVELLTGILFAVIFWKFQYSWVTVEYLILAWGLVVVSFIDIDLMILPDVFTLPGIVIGLVGAALNPERSFNSALIGVLMGGGFLWLIAYLYLLFRKEEGMGGGDIKLLAWIGAVLGWTAIPFVVLASSIIGSVVGLVLATRSEAGLKSVIPFGPYLALAAILYLLGGEQLGLWYIGLFLPDLAPVN